MKRTAWFVLAGLAVAAPALAAPPFGSFGGKVGGGNSASGVIGLHGWALDDDGVAAVDIYVDGLPIGRTIYGLARSGVTARHPGFPDSAAAGYVFELDTSRYLNGLHKLEARVISRTGERVTLNPVTLEILNTTHNLRPFGAIDFPSSSLEMYGFCDDLLPRRYNVVSGWALDVGLEEGDMGVAYVELLVDGGRYANSQISCANIPELFGLVNCYGLRRLDIESTFPYLRDAPLSGFRFVLSVDDLLDFGYTPGRHTLTVRVGDISGQVRNIDEIPVSFLCADRGVNEEGIGWLGPVRSLGLPGGVLTANGWALDRDGVDQVRIHIDGQEVGFATYGLSRPTISQQYPDFPNSIGPGWEFLFDSRQLSNGPHHLQALLYDPAGETTLIGEREFIVHNP